MYRSVYHCLRAPELQINQSEDKYSETAVYNYRATQETSLSKQDKTSVGLSSLSDPPESQHRKFTRVVMPLTYDGRCETTNVRTNILSSIFSLCISMESVNQAVIYHLCWKCCLVRQESCFEVYGTIEMHHIRLNYKTPTAPLLPPLWIYDIWRTCEHNCECM